MPPRSSTLNHCAFREAFIENITAATTTNSEEANISGKHNNDAQLSGWAYDLAATRGLEGSFGQEGALRDSILSLVAAFGIALWPFVAPFLQGPSSLSDSARVPVESLLPLIITSLTTAVTLASKEPELAMLPYVDLANHKSGGVMAFEYNFMNDLIVFKNKEDSSRKSSEDVANDEWIVFDYGGSDGITNDRLLGEYGFVEHDNPADIFELTTLASSNYDTPLIILLGRNGAIRQSSDVPMQKIVEAAVVARASLAAPSLSQIELNDPVDVERATLATTWRSEKIMLLDEFIEKRSKQD